MVDILNFACNFIRMEKNKHLWSIRTIIFFPSQLYVYKRLYIFVSDFNSDTYLHICLLLFLITVDSLYFYSVHIFFLCPSFTSVQQGYGHLIVLIPFHFAFHWLSLVTNVSLLVSGQQASFLFVLRSRA